MNTSMSRYLPDGLFIVVCKHGYYGHWTLPLPDFHVWGYMKNIVHEHKVNRRQELHHQMFIAARYTNDPDVLHEVTIILNFQYL
jgi:hypothetical protein